MASVQFTQTKLTVNKKTGLFGKDANGYYEIMVGGLNAINSAGELYILKGAQDLFEESSYLMNRIRDGYLYGEKGHPKFTQGMTRNDIYRRLLTIDTANDSHHFKSVTLDTDYAKDNKKLVPPNFVAVIAKLKPSGVHAKSLEDALENPDQNVAFSVRGITDDKLINGVRHRQLINIVTWDWVHQPGIATSNKWDSASCEEYPILIETTDSFGMDVKVLEELANEKVNSVATESADLARQIITSSNIQTSIKKPIYLKW